MHHAALNGAGAHNRHLDHQIIEFTRQHSGQKIHLRPAFHLKHANRIRPAQHIVNNRVFLWHRFQRQARATLLCDQIKAFADAGQHPQRQNIHLQEAQRINIVLVPFNHRAPFHRGVFNRAHLIQPPLGDDKAADMLRQMARKADDFADQLQGQRQAAIRRVQPDFAQFGRVRGRGGPAPALPRNHRQHILTKAHDLAHLADGGARSEMNDRRRQPRPVAAIFGIDMLDHLFAAFMFKIHVNIGRLAACFGHEAFKHHRDYIRCHLGNAQRIADHRIGRRPPPLAQDALRAGKFHDVIHRQEIGGKAKGFDNAQFLHHLGAGGVRHPCGKAFGQANIRDPGQAVLRRLAIGNLIGVFVGQLRQ